MQKQIPNKQKNLPKTKEEPLKKMHNKNTKQKIFARKNKNKTKPLAKKKETDGKKTKTNPVAN